MRAFRAAAHAILVAAAVIAPAPARADIDGWASAGAGVSIGTFVDAPYLAADTTPPAFSASGTVDGVAVPAPASGSFSTQSQAHFASGLASAAVSGNASTLLGATPGGAPATINGMARAEADRTRGLLRMQAATEDRLITVPRNGGTVMQQASSAATAYAEIRQSFDVFVPAGYTEIPVITLTVKIDGTLSQTFADGYTMGVRVLARLNNVAGPGGSLESLEFLEDAVTRRTLSLSAPVLGLACGDGRATCNSWVSLWVALDLSARGQDGNWVDGKSVRPFSGDSTLDFWNTAAISLTSTGDATLQRLETGGSFAWVNPAVAPVPEPAAPAMWATGLALVALWRSRRTAR